MEEYIKIGKIDVTKLGEYKNTITTNEVILTEERMKHIKLKHKEHFDEIKPYIKEVIENPNYILKENKHTDTIILLKEIIKNELKTKMIIKLNTFNEKGKYNSVITFWKIRDRDYNKAIRKGKILYEKV